MEKDCKRPQSIRKRLDHGQKRHEFQTDAVNATTTKRNA